MIIYPKIVLQVIISLLPIVIITTLQLIQIVQQMMIRLEGVNISTQIMLIISFQKTFTNIISLI